MRHYVEENLDKLEKNEIFVFGSNGNGNHSGGTARLAVEKFGAIEGQARGLQGKSYGFETLDKNMKKISIKEIKKQFLELFKFAKNNQDKTFLVTKIGCGIAGFNEDQIKGCFKKEKVPSNVKMPLGWMPLKGYKAFNNGLVCRGVQYREGQIKEFKEDIEVCSKGFHFCLNPLDTLNYYDITESEFAEVEGLGDLQDHNEDSKLVTNKLKVNLKLNLSLFIKASFEFLWDRFWYKDNATSGDYSQVATSGDYSQVATNGDYSKVATSGYYSQVATSGGYSQVATSGYSSQVATSGYYSQVATSGYYSQVATSGDSSKVATNGDSSQVATSGDSSQVATSGYSSKVATNGYSSKVATSGDYSQVATSGDSSKVATNGNYSQVATSGDSSKVATNGDSSQVATSGCSSKVATNGDSSQVATSGCSSQVEINGRDSVGANIGINGSIKGKKGCWITLAEYDTENKIKFVRSVQIDDKNIKENTWYKLQNNEFIEVN